MLACQVRELAGVGVDRLHEHVGLGLVDHVARPVGAGDAVARAGRREQAGEHEETLGARRSSLVAGTATGSHGETPPVGSQRAGTGGRGAGRRRGAGPGAADRPGSPLPGAARGGYAAGPPGSPG